MWKYVSRRIKDSIDKTYCNVLDVKRTWTCSGNGNAGNGLNTCGAIEQFISFSCVNKRNRCGANFKSSSKEKDDEFKEKIHHDSGYNRHSLAGALTWVRVNWG